MTCWHCGEDVETVEYRAYGENGDTAHECNWFCKDCARIYDAQMDQFARERKPAAVDVIDRFAELLEEYAQSLDRVNDKLLKLVEEVKNDR